MPDEKESIETISQVKHKGRGEEVDDIDEEEIKKSENIEETCDVLGLLIGGAAGLIAGLVISFNTIFAMQIGMFLGLIVSTRIKKKKGDNV
ncbi:MAG: hypothetical protein LE168_05070 [Endomicrobium sp.]|nr:hypothetical protein [Endomicrobium sp.]